MDLRGKSLNSVLYDAWASCEQGQWTKSKFLQNIRTRHTSTVRGRRRWLTAKEMDDRFGVELATQIRNRKLLDPELKEREVRPHPELPDSEARTCDLLMLKPKISRGSLDMF